MMVDITAEGKHDVYRIKAYFSLFYSNKVLLSLYVHFTSAQC